MSNNNNGVSGGGGGGNDKELDYVNNVKYHWLYEAKNDHWWHFDSDSNELLETSYNDKADQTDLSVNGKPPITINFIRMVQTTSTGNGRNIKRVDDLSTVKLRGIAGTYYNNDLFAQK
jgi:hypothetical protein